MGRLGLILLSSPHDLENFMGFCWLNTNKLKQSLLPSIVLQATGWSSLHYRNMDMSWRLYVIIDFEEFKKSKTLFLIIFLDSGNTLLYTNTCVQTYRASYLTIWGIQIDRTIQSNIRFKNCIPAEKWSHTRRRNWEHPGESSDEVNAVGWR